MLPDASCRQSFANLMDVYRIAVFHTNIYKKEEIFRQEGWNYHLENPEDEITYNGVVYNEMKGAYSSPEDVLDREILNALYPDTPYGFESGGDPQCIPDLKYEDFLAFHGKYYHPSMLTSISMEIWMLRNASPGWIRNISLNTEKKR